MRYFDGTWQFSPKISTKVAGLLWVPAFDPWHMFFPRKLFQVFSLKGRPPLQPVALGQRFRLQLQLKFWMVGAVQAKC